MTLRVDGVGLVTPLALTATEHAFYVRAGAAVGPHGVFVDADGEPIDAQLCPWIDAATQRIARMSWMARAAVADALGGVAPSQPVPAFLVLPQRYLGPEHIAWLAQSLTSSLPISIEQTLSGSAAGLSALSLAAPRAAPVMVIAVDSFIAPEILSDYAAGATPWERNAPPLSEGAAAVLVRPGEAGMWGTVSWAGGATEAANDDNEVIVDARATTALLRAMLQAHPERQPIVQSYGPHNVDELRQLTWNYACCRCFEPGFWPACELVCVEDDVGQLGAASGLAHLAYGLARAKHVGFTDLDETPPGRTFAAWGVSRDGGVGVAMAEGASS